MEKLGILFDFDYTLGDSTEAIFRGFQKSFQVMGLPEPEREAVRCTVGYTLQDSYTKLTGDEDEAHRQRFYELFQQYGRPLMLEGTVLLEGAAELLAALKREQIAVAIVSTKLGQTIRSILAHHGMSELVSFVVGGEDVERHKPDPEGLLYAIGRLAISKDKLLFCGDTVIDAETARRAGVDFCAVLGGTTGREAFSPYPCLHIADSLFELKAWLNV